MEARDHCQVSSSVLSTCPFETECLAGPEFADGLDFLVGQL